MRFLIGFPQPPVAGQPDGLQFSLSAMTVTTGPDPQHRPADCRLSHEPPAAIAKRGWRYHHIGVPTAIQHPGETHLAEYGLYVAGFSTSPYGVEWMRFEESSPLPGLIKSVPHVAFEVDDLEAALEGQEVICPPGSPSEGVRAAMIVDHGALVELIWFRKNSDVHQE